MDGLFPTDEDTHNAHNLVYFFSYFAFHFHVMCFPLPYPIYFISDSLDGNALLCTMHFMYAIEKAYGAFVLGPFMVLCTFSIKS